jgi:hypothetical protein
MDNPKLAAFTYWLVVIAFVGGVGGYHIVPQILNLYELSKSNRVTHGEIVETYPQMHSTCKYRFAVDGQSYDNIGRSCGDNHVGQQIVVYFSPRDPNDSVNGDPRAWFINDLIPFALALVVFPLMAATIAYWRVRRGGKLWSQGGRRRRS